MGTTGFFVAISLAALAGMWVSADARQRGFSTPASVAWGMGVFMALILFLPLYLLVRSRLTLAPKAEIPSPPPTGSPAGTRVCRTCGALYVPPARFCPWCGAPRGPESGIEG